MKKKRNKSRSAKGHQENKTIRFRQKTILERVDRDGKPIDQATLGVQQRQMLKDMIANGGAIAPNGDWNPPKEIPNNVVQFKKPQDDDTLKYNKQRDPSDLAYAIEYKILHDMTVFTHLSEEYKNYKAGKDIKFISKKELAAVNQRWEDEWWYTRERTEEYRLKHGTIVTPYEDVDEIGARMQAHLDFTKESFNKELLQAMDKQVKAPVVIDHGTEEIISQVPSSRTLKYRRPITYQVADCIDSLVKEYKQQSALPSIVRDMCILTGNVSDLDVLDSMSSDMMLSILTSLIMDRKPSNLLFDEDKWLDKVQFQHSEIERYKELVAYIEQEGRDLYEEVGTLELELDKSIVQIEELKTQISNHKVDRFYDQFETELEARKSGYFIDRYENKLEYLSTLVYKQQCTNKMLVERIKELEYRWKTYADAPSDGLAPQDDAKIHAQIQMFKRHAEDHGFASAYTMIRYGSSKMGQHVERVVENRKKELKQWSNINKLLAQIPMMLQQQPIFDMMTQARDFFDRRQRFADLKYKYFKKRLVKQARLTCKDAWNIGRFDSYSGVLTTRAVNKIIGVKRLELSNPNLYKHTDSDICSQSEQWFQDKQAIRAGKYMDWWSKKIDQLYLQDDKRRLEQIKSTGRGKIIIGAIQTVRAVNKVLQTEVNPFAILKQREEERKQKELLEHKKMVKVNRMKRKAKKKANAILRQQIRATQSLR